ncbi:MAG: hypothetical protein HY747_12510 [Elusimicrobia bacterium]|nr:hypothetical protein [Elusimicrobiota bacterium]
MEFSQKLWKHPSTYEGAFSIDSDIQLSMPPDVLKERPNAYRGVNGDLRISLDHDVVKEYNQFIAGPSPEYRLEGSSISLTKGKMAINGIDFTYAIRQGYNEYTEADKKRLCYGCDDVDIPEERNFCYMIFYATTPAVILIRFYSYDFATASRFIPSKDEEARRGVERMKQEALKVIKTFRWYGPKNKEQR